MSPEERKLVERAQTIGGLVESNARFTQRVAEAVAELGDVDGVTVGQLVELIERESETVRRLYAGAA